MARTLLFAWLECLNKCLRITGSFQWMEQWIPGRKNLKLYGALELVMLSKVELTKGQIMKAILNNFSGKPKTIGERLRFWRLTSMRTLLDINQMIGVSQGSLIKMEKSVSMPSSLILERLNQETDLNISWLLTGSGPVIRKMAQAKVKTHFGDCNSNIQKDNNGWERLRHKKRSSRIVGMIERNTVSKNDWSKTSQNKAIKVMALNNEEDQHRNTVNLNNFLLRFEIGGPLRGALMENSIYSEHRVWVFG